MCATPVWAQLTGTLKGSAKDASGKPIEGATVELVDAEKGNKLTLKTNSKGEFFFIAVVPGTYKATLIKDGQVLDELNKIPIAMTETREINFNLAKDRRRLRPKSASPKSSRKNWRRCRSRTKKSKA